MKQLGLVSLFFYLLVSCAPSADDAALQNVYDANDNVILAFVHDTSSSSSTTASASSGADRNKAMLCLYSGMADQTTRENADLTGFNEIYWNHPSFELIAEMNGATIVEQIDSLFKEDPEKVVLLTRAILSTEFEEIDSADLAIIKKKLRDSKTAARSNCKKPEAIAADMVKNHAELLSANLDLIQGGDAIKGLKTDDAGRFALQLDDKGTLYEFRTLNRASSNSGPSGLALTGSDTRIADSALVKAVQANFTKLEELVASPVATSSQLDCEKQQIAACDNADSFAASFRKRVDETKGPLTFDGLKQKVNQARAQYQLPEQSILDLASLEFRDLASKIGAASTRTITRPQFGRTINSSSTSSSDPSEE